MNEISQLQLFRNATSHRNTGKYLFYADFTPALRDSIIERFNLSQENNLREYFKMYSPAHINLKKPVGYINADFSKYYKGVDMPEGAYIDGLGVLHVPGSMYHFTHYVSPLRQAENFTELEEYIFPDFKSFSDADMKEQVEKAHQEGQVALSWIGHMYEDSWQIRGYEQFQIGRAHV